MATTKKKAGQAEIVKWFGPVLDALRQLGGSARPREVVEQITKNLKISDEQLQEVTKTGVPKFYNQIAWARQYFVWEGLLDDSTRGVWTLTPLGQATTLNEDQARDIFIKWVGIHRKTTKERTGDEVEKQQDDEEPKFIEDTATPRLLEVLQSVTPKGFEDICKRLLRKHGFENVVVTGGSHDGGIDGYGILELNPFVSMKVLFQCKRYKGTVSRAQVGDFRNAVLGRAEKGIIMTTGIFSQDAIREASRDGVVPIELIDGVKLVELFESAQLGVKPKTIYEVDLNFFEPFIEQKK